MIREVSTVAALRGVTGSVGDSVRLLGYYSANDGGGGPLRVADSTS